MSNIIPIIVLILLAIGDLFILSLKISIIEDINDLRRKKDEKRGTRR